MGDYIVIIFILLAAVILLAMHFKFINEAEEVVISRLGVFHTVWAKGPHVLVPVIDKIYKRISLKEQVIDLPQQDAITKENVNISVDSVVFYKVTDSYRYAYGAEDPIDSIHKITQTTLRNVIGALEMDDILTSREQINDALKKELDEVTDKWGIKVTRVELSDISTPPSIRQAMEKQLKSERERREMIIRAEGESKSSVLMAEANKKTAILKAEADREAAILNAEAAKTQRILEAEGKAEAARKEAEGEAEAVRLRYEAEAKGLKLLSECAPSEAALRLKSFECLQKVADGQSTKIIVPSELQNVAGLATAVKTFLK